MAEAAAIQHLDELVGIFQGLCAAQGPAARAGQPAQRATALLQRVKDLWRLQGTKHESERLQLLHDQALLQRERRAGTLQKARKDQARTLALAATPPVASRCDPALELPAAERPAVQEYRALKAKLRHRSVQLTQAQEVALDAEQLLSKLEDENASLRAQLQACQLTPQEASRLRALVTVCQTQADRIRALEQQLEALKHKRAEEKRTHAKQVKTLRDALAATQDSQSWVLSQYSQPVTLVSAQPSNRRTSGGRDDTLAQYPPPAHEHSCLTVTSECMGPEASELSRATPQPMRLQEGVVRAVMGPAAGASQGLKAEASGGMLPALSAEPSSLSNCPPRRPYAYATAPRTRDEDARRRAAMRSGGGMQMLTPSKTAPTSASPQPAHSHMVPITPRILKARVGSTQLIAQHRRYLLRTHTSSMGGGSPYLTQTAHGSSGGSSKRPAVPKPASANRQGQQPKTASLGDSTSQQADTAAEPGTEALQAPGTSEQQTENSPTQLQQLDAMQPGASESTDVPELSPEQHDQHVSTVDDPSMTQDAGVP